MYAELVINIEAPLEGVFHYQVPPDLEPKLVVGSMVEVQFGRRQAQGIIVGFSEESPVPETKPIISLIDVQPVVRDWQIELARWLSQRYLTALNACIRLMLPPGLTRWADITLEINPYWDGSGRLTETQKQLVDLLQKRGDLRGRQVAREMPKGSNWREAANQLTRRSILIKGSRLDPPRMRPKVIRTAELIASPQQILKKSGSLGRKNKQADILYYLANLEDPLPLEQTVLKAVGANTKHLSSLQDRKLIKRWPEKEILLRTEVAPDPNLPDSEADEFDIIFQKLPAPRESFADQVLVKRLEKTGLLESVTTSPSVSLMANAGEVRDAIFRLRGGEKYNAILKLLALEARPVHVREIYERTNSALNHLRKLAANDLIRLGSEETWRDPLADRDFVPDSPPELTTDQAGVWKSVEANLAAAGLVKPVLIHGVTGSGKTEIYLRAAAWAIDHGQKAIILVPEIALTPQTVRRFAARFPGQVAVLHSRLSDGERYDTWRRARDGQFDIIVGPRSALFTPLDPLGVIVIDEEHDSSYKQTPPIPPPYYHARDAAVQLGEITGAVTVLGSATPDLTVYHGALSGHYQLLELPNRIMGHRQRINSQVERVQKPSVYQQLAEDPEDAVSIPLPPVRIVDLRQELRAGNRSIFSRTLRAAVNETLERSEQAILFLNRRGTATFIMCRDCGLVLNCPRCEMPLTYHRPGTMLVCHHCGRREPPHENCPRCGSHHIKYFGLGTEKLELLVQQQWPDARIVRWDRDTTSERGSHEQILSSFIDHEADILIGTQMIAKGLDLPLVTLVGVISADVSLGLPDYKIGERTFQILAQVAGRAGRGLLGGQVIFQTYQPEHYAIQAAADHDYMAFYLAEIAFRTQLRLPPYRRLAKLTTADPISDRAEFQARELVKALEVKRRELAMSATELIGPVPPFFHRIGGRYRWQIIIRSPDPNRLLKDFPIPREWILELDPLSTL